MSSGDIISSGRINTKYELTPVLEDDDYMNDFFRKTLSDFSTDPATRESEYKSKLSSSTSGVVDRRYGRSSDSQLWKPDLFLADMSRDPRSLMEHADLTGMRTFMEHRKDAIKINLLNDDDKRIHSKTMTHSEDRRKKDQAFHRVREKHTNFQEQLLNNKPYKMLSQQEILKNKQSLANYVINSGKNQYIDRKDANRHSEFQNKKYGDRNVLQKADYDLLKKHKNFSKQSDRKSKGMNSDKINSNIRKGANETVDSIDKKRLNYVSKNNRAMPSKRTVAIHKIIENNRMFRNTEQMAGKKMGSNIIPSSIGNKELRGIENSINKFRNDEEFIKETISNKQSGSEKIIMHKINKNKEMIPLINDMRMTDKSLSNKQSLFSKTNNVLRKNRDGVDVSELVYKSLRSSSFSNKNKYEDRTVMVNSSKNIKEFTPFFNKSVIDTRGEALGNNNKEISIYNYKSHKPVVFDLASIKEQRNNVVIEEGMKGSTNLSKDIIENGGMRARVEKYKQIGLNNSKEAGDMNMKTGTTAHRITVKPAGSAGVIGNKFIRDKIDKGDSDAEDEELKEMTNLRKTY